MELRKNEGYDTENFSWNNCPEDSRKDFEAAASQNKIEFRQHILDYADKLDHSELKNYIGQNRIKFVRVFRGEDIFEMRFPCHEYPPFKKLSKQELQEQKQKVATPSYHQKKLTAFLKKRSSPADESSFISGMGKSSTSTPSAGSSGKDLAKKKKVTVESPKSPFKALASSPSMLKNVSSTRNNSTSRNEDSDESSGIGNEELDKGDAGVNCTEANNELESSSEVSDGEGPNKTTMAQPQHDDDDEESSEVGEQSFVLPLPPLSSINLNQSNQIRQNLQGGTSSEDESSSEESLSTSRRVERGPPHGKKSFTQTKSDDSESSSDEDEVIPKTQSPIKQKTSGYGNEVSEDSSDDDPEPDW